MRILPLVSLLLAIPAIRAQEVIIRDPAGLAATLRGLKPGLILKIGPGNYPGGHYVTGVADLTVEALDPRQPPHFKGATEAWHFSRCPNLTVRNLRISGQTGNGINLDDGGDLNRPVTGVTLDNLEISDIGPTGNHDGIKGSGLDNFTIRNCSVTGWGGQGIDLVGCHEGIITGCRLTGKAGFSASAGVQLKGGCSGIVVEKSVFTDAGERPINLGGSTGLDYFRPAGAKFEAKGIIARGNTIQGGLCAAAFVGLDGGRFEDNTILYPTKWIFRILQETREPGFPPCRNVMVSGNRVVFRRADVRVFVNVGTHVAADTFRFENNHWFAEDKPSASQPVLPTEETGGVYGSDPRSTKETK